MKSRVLPVMTIGFGVLFALKTASLSYANTESSTMQAEVSNNLDHLNTDNNSGGNSGGADEKSICLTADLARALSEQKTDLSRRTQTLITREAGLKALETRVTEQIDLLKDARNKFEMRLSKIGEQADNDLTHLVTMYQTMKPKKAAEIFDNMDPVFAAGFLRRMDGVRAGLIMSEIDPKTSYRISLIIANQNAAWRSNKPFKNPKEL